jgi:hypothetical protein
VISKRISVLSVLLVLWSVAAVVADSDSDSSEVAPCDIPQMRQFDFWIGEWNLTWPDSGRGTNIITPILDSCVIMEQFTTRNAQPFRGRSLSTYDVETDQWKQTWVDNAGNYLDFTGGLRDGQMILEREAVDSTGKEFLQRMVFFNIKDDSFDWNWERSLDGGDTWETLWPIHYERRKK